MSIKLPEGPGRRAIKKAGLAALIAAIASSCTLAGAPAIAHQPTVIETAR